jgi:acetyl-CoA carboxylase biotin carboxyl carrier protein
MASKKADGGKEQAAGGFTLGDVTKLVDALEDSDVRSLLWTRGGEKIVIRRGPAPVVMAAPVAAAAPLPLMTSIAAPAPAPAATGSAPKGAEKAPEKPGHVVTSPFVGTFYRAPSPDSPAFADVGTVVKKGQVLCIVEAMKLMNEIEAEVDGKITEIFVLNATPVEFGEKLFRIEPV